MGRGPDTHRVSPRNRRTNLPRELFQDSRILRRPSRPIGQPRGQGSSLVRQCDVDSERRRAGRARERVSKSAPLRGRLESRRSSRRNSKPYLKSEEDDSNRKTGGSTFKGTPLDKGTTVRWWLRTRGKPKKKKKKKKCKKSQKKSRKRLKSPLPRRSPGQAASKTRAGDFDKTCNRRGGEASGSGNRGSPDSGPDSSHVEVAEVARFPERPGSRAQKRAVDTGVFGRSIVAERRSRSPRHHHTAREVPGVGGRGIELVGSAEPGVGSTGSRKDRQYSGGSCSSKGVQAGGQGREGARKGKGKWYEDWRWKGGSKPRRRETARIGRVSRKGNKGRIRRLREWSQQNPTKALAWCSWAEFPNPGA